MNVKLVITGPFASGKTELIKTISEIDVVLTERKICSPTEKAVKEETTVAMDFGRITIDSDLVLYLFGTPGQDRFDFMWEILSEGALGTVVMVDSTNGESILKARRIIDFFYIKVGTPYIVAANKQDLPNAWPPEFIRSYLDLDDTIKVVPCVAKEKGSVKKVLLELLDLVMEHILGWEGTRMKRELREEVDKVILDNSVLIDRDGLSDLYASVLKIAGFGLGGILYTAGKKAGTRGAMLLRDHLKIDGRDLTEAMVYAFEVGKWGKMVVDDCEGGGCRVRVTENVLVRRLERKKKPVCHPLAGYIAGFFELALGERVQVKEEACMGKGDPACIFHVEIG